MAECGCSWPVLAAASTGRLALAKWPLDRIGQRRARPMREHVPGPCTGRLAAGLLCSAKLLPPPDGPFGARQLASESTIGPQQAAAATCCSTAGRPPPTGARPRPERAGRHQLSG